MRFFNAVVLVLASAPALASNVVTIPVVGGRAELEWLTTSSFRFIRRWDGNALQTTPRMPEVRVDRQDLGFAIQMTTGQLTVEVRKADGRV